MPDDNLFTDEPDDTDPTPEREALTLESVQAMVQQQVQPLQTELAITQERLQAANAMNESLRNAPAYRDSGNYEPDPTGDEYIEQFTNDALGATKSVAERVTNERFQRLEPFLQRQNDTMHATLVNAERAAVESEFGPGVWDTHFQHLMEARMADLRTKNAISLANPDVVHNEVLAIMGHKRNELTQAKTDLATKAVETEQAQYERIRQELNMTGMTGGTHAPARRVDAPLTDSDRDFIASKAAAGFENVDIQKLRAAASRGNSWSDWQAAKAQESKR